ncbi:MAG: hypothetical protein AB1487_03990, partial [Thermodesulfobacteriota bacterium]
SQPPFSKGRRNISPFEKGGLRGIFEAPFSGRLALFKQLKCYDSGTYSKFTVLGSQFFNPELGTVNRFYHPSFHYSIHPIKTRTFEPRA